MELSVSHGNCGPELETGLAGPGRGAPAGPAAGGQRPFTLAPGRRAPSGNPYPFTNPPFYVISHGYDMDITTSGIFYT